MNKISFIIIFIVLFVNSGLLGATNCPNPISDWVRAYENTPFARSWDLVTDSQGNIFITGSFSTGIFSESSDFDPTDGVDEHSANGDTDIFISKLHADGSYAWTRTMGGPEADEGRGIDTDPMGNVFVVGTFYDTVDFDPTDGVDEHTAMGRHNIFITKLNADGSYGWTAILGGGASEDSDSFSTGNNIALDPDGNIFVTGCFAQTVDFDPTDGDDLHSATNSQDIYVTKIFSDGSYGWTKTFGGTALDCGYGIAVDSSGNVFVSGQFRGTVDFLPGIGVDELTAFGQFGENFVTKYFSVGSYAWTRKLPRAGTEENAIVVNVAGNVYLTGGFRGTQDFDPTSGEDWHSTNIDPERSDIYVTKLFRNGSYGWTSTFGGSESDIGEDIAIGLQGNLYVTSIYSNSPSDSEIMAMKLLPDGSISWTRTMGSLGNDIAVGIIVDNSGDLLLTGLYRDTVDFDPGCGIAEHSSSLLGGSEMFILKLTCEEATADVNNDGFADLLDFAFLQSCFSGEAPTTCNNGCEGLDFDHDDDIDLDDYFEFIMFME